MKLLQHIAPSVQNLSPYQPGRPAAAVAAERGVAEVIKLASNENPLGAGKLAQNALAKFSAQTIGRYPDANGATLRAALAKKHNLPEECFVLGNGSNDILELAAQLFLDGNAAAVYSQHSFIVYALATAARRARAVVVPAAAGYAHDLPAMAKAAQADGARLVFIANPNNPTGTFHPAAKLRECLRDIPSDVLAVVDEAYYEYLPALEEPTLPLLAEFDNLLITRTFSKIHGLAGLRAGYGIGAAALTDFFNRVRQPFNMNAAAQAAAAAALDDAEHLQKSYEMNKNGLAAAAEIFNKKGIEYIPSFANFISFRPANADTLYEKMLDNGVVVRKLREYEMPDWLRVSIGTPIEMQKFFALL